MTKEKHLFRALFIVSVFLLLLNDFYLKFEYHNFFTGKLSDFVGLFAFPYFFSCFFPKKVKSIYVFTAILFLFWKSEFSQPMFDAAHSYGIGINRIVDYTDLIALFILPISYRYWKMELKVNYATSTILKVLIIGFSSFSFIATTLATHYEPLNLKSDFETTVNYSFETVKNKLNVYSDSVIPVDYYIIDLKDKKAKISTKISLQKTNSIETKILLDSIIGFNIQSSSIFFSGINQEDVKYLKSMKQDKLEELFKLSIENYLKKNNDND